MATYLRRCTPRYHWRARDGTIVRIREMGDRHLFHTIRMLRRGAENRRMVAILIGYRMLAGLQGEMAIDDVERGIERLENHDVTEDGDDVLGEFDHPSLPHLCEEAMRRGLEVDKLPGRMMFHGQT